MIINDLDWPNLPSGNGDVVDYDKDDSHIYSKMSNYEIIGIFLLITITNKILKPKYNTTNY